MNNSKIDSERRAAGVKRVNLETVVEICGRDAQVPAFEAETVELSGRGMHVRTAYLPELNAPLVLRFEDQGREVVIEGEVAWRRELSDTGEFGIKFTALDPKGVEVLRELCGTKIRASEPEAAPERKPATEPGSAVKLHIEGLNAPMRARVRDANVRRMQVGSNLEFLKVGRSIEVEDVDQGIRKDAKIDSVTVSIDPQTQVPQLVVALRYSDVTPEPSVVDSEPSEAVSEEAPSRKVGAAHRPAPEGPSQMAASDEDVEVDERFGSEADGELGLGDDLDDDFSDEELGKGQLKHKLEQGLARAEQLAKKSGDYMGALGKRTVAGLGKLVGGAGEQLGTLRARKEGPKRRTAAAPPSSAAFSQEVRRLKLQPQHRNRSVAPGNSRMGALLSDGKLRSRAAIGAISALVLIGGLTYSFTGSSSKEASTETATAVLPVANVAPVLTPAAAPGAALPGAAPQTIIADVPLFGQTTLAAPEPAPLGAAPVEQGETDPSVGTVPAPVTPTPGASSQESEYDDRAPEEAYVDSPRRNLERDEAENRRAKSSPAAVQPWGKGRMYLPTVHRLRLDGPATALKGYSKDNGFSVVLPGRKVVENPKPIAKRDDRLSSVTADSSREGAVVRFKFRGQVPSYKVRVRGNYVEFFISAVERR